MISRPLALDYERLLVLAPHPDDEALGCGGLLAASGAEGRQARVVFVTDGGASHPGSASWDRSRLGSQRRREALASLAILGLDESHALFLELADADMPPDGSPAHAVALVRLAALLVDMQPDQMVLPWRRDPHRDHRDTWHLGHQALQAAGVQPATLEYAVWLDELGAADDFPRSDEMERVAFDITDVLDRKRAAIAAHLTQTTGLIADDPTAFRLSAKTINRLAGPVETYWRPCP